MQRKAEKMYDIFAINSYPLECTPCNHCSVRQDSSRSQEMKDRPSCDCDIQETHLTRKETGAAFVFFKTRYEAATVAQTRLPSNPMLWVTGKAPEPPDMYWLNQCVPYEVFWLRRIGTLMATMAFMIFFIAPVTIVQSLANLQQFEKAFPFLRGFLQKPTVDELVTGYLPSVILMLFLIEVPPLMIMFQLSKGLSLAASKKAACLKVLYFNIWNVFFVNLVSGTVLNKP